MGTYPLLVAEKPIVFFDTNCLLCSRFVKILLKYDKQKLYYSGFESALAGKYLSASLRHKPETIVFYQDNVLHFKSEAVFKIISHLRYPWPLLSIFNLLPTAFNNMLYSWVARKRLVWFGQSENCFMPTPEQKSRFFE